tara:strand:- start:174 stop:1154 length:981 start_codon:yes stop_codon:yes gene_type:complete
MPRVLRWDNLLLAYCRAEKGLRRKQEARLYASRLNRNLRFLRKGLEDGSFPFGFYRRFQVRDPKRRVIHAPSFPERVAQHALFNVCEPFLERRLLHDVHACRKGRGTHGALRRAQIFARRHQWRLRLDVRKFFDSVPHAILLVKLATVFKDPLLLQLFESILNGYQTSPRHGLPIGSLSSQHFANFFLSSLDRLAKETIQVPGYLRYMDDFVLWADSREFLLQARDELISHLAELGLTLKRMSQPVSTEDGMIFLGHKVFPFRMEVERRARTRFVRKARHLRFQWDRGEIPDLELQQRHAALSGYGSLANLRPLQRQLESSTGKVK